MAVDLSDTAIGLGVYSVQEASRLTSVSARRIRGWLEGYQRVNDLSNARTPVVHGDFNDHDDSLQLSFADLLEVRVIDGFRQLGVSWREIHRAVGSAAQILKVTHPFINRRFLTDGRKLFLQLPDGLKNKQLIALADKQHVFNSFVAPYLKGLEFSRNEPVLWRPMGRRRRVVLDPARSFGRPIGTESGVPTKVLASFARSSSIRETADWYETSIGEVRDVIRFEQQLAA